MMLPARRSEDVPTRAGRTQASRRLLRRRLLFPEFFRESSEENGLAFVRDSSGEKGLAFVRESFGEKTRESFREIFLEAFRKVFRKGLRKIFCGTSVPAAAGLSGPVLSGPVLSGPGLSGPVLSGPGLSGPVLSGPLFTRRSAFREMAALPFVKTVFPAFAKPETARRIQFQILVPAAAALSPVSRKQPAAAVSPIANHPKAQCAAFFMEFFSSSGSNCIFGHSLSTVTASGISPDRSSCRFYCFRYSSRQIQLSFCASYISAAASFPT